MRDVLKELWKNKVLVLICLFVCVGVATIIGYKKSNFYDRISTKDKEKIEKYYAKLNKYEQETEETEENVNLLNDKIKELQNYVNNSILMHLNPDNIYMANVTFYSEASIDEATIIKDKYWNEILSLSINENTYNISIMHFSGEQALECINSIIGNIESNYKISAPTVTCYLKADMSIGDKQKECLLNLKNYVINRNELEISLKNHKTLTSKYKSEAKPKVLTQKDLKPISVIFRYSLFGFVACLLVLISAFTVKHIL